MNTRTGTPRFCLREGVAVDTPVFLNLFFLFRVLVRSFVLVISECYEIIFPWLNIVADPEQVSD